MFISECFRFHPEKKVAKLTQLEAGLEVIETDLETFDYLRHVNEIVTSYGPAMIFRRNKKLKRLNFNALNKLKGGNIDIVLEDDHFAEEAGDGSAGFNDLMMLESVSRETDQRTEKCSKKFLEVKTTGGSSGGVVMYLGYFLIALFVILLAVAIILTLKEWKKWKTEQEQAGKKKKKNKKDETNKKKKSGSEEKKTKKTATKGPKSKNTPVKENPKKK
ncbi:hypothetical protein GCK72_015140 [Caenorhabditis remanei]|uniref:Receptor L-domain domain-containing protein n=1 Tax=Caenorhabditis remanei TaxID=31234 RepID=A0A6A5GVQ2_CAERE|nr:hypothetical protein GCK72_015140 [Caenorhabditis remanei]KAF1758681.1 hypothetical protein GCK72_015140 [Caenorhabditis remanei]